MNRELYIDNRTLVNECIRGDKEALSLFYTRFAPRMYSLILRYVHDAEDAEDILHDGFIVAYTRLDTLKNADKADHWLATIMKNLALQFLQSQDVASVLHEIPEVEDAPEIQDIIDMATLESLIHKLPDGYQKVFRLAVLENKSHKEIARLLGIAPNTSSSQLFHAKIMMRRLISEYRMQAGLTVLLLALVSTGFLLYDSIKDTESLAPSQIAQENKTAAPPASQSTESPALQGGNSIIGNATPNLIARAGSTSSAGKSAEEPADDAVQPSGTGEESGIKKESGIKTEYETKKEPGTKEEPGIKEEQKSAKEAESYYAHSGYVPDDSKLKSVWTSGMSINPGIVGIEPVGNGDFGNDLSSPGPGHDPDDDKDKTPSETPATRSANTYRDYRDVSHHNYMPLSVTFSASRKFSERIELETGLTYTYLHTTFETANAKSHCHWHYLGIPLKLNVSLFSTDRFRMYVSAGAQFDIPLYSRADVSAVSASPDLQPGRFSSSAVWSVSMSCGFAYGLSSRTEIFVEPMMQHHFSHSFQVPNTWTDNPWGFSLPIGFRIKW